MSKIIRWNPVREMLTLQNAMERMFDDVYGDVNPAMKRWDLAIDLAEKNDAFVVKASLPGIDPNDLDITVEDDVLIIKGETKEDKTIEEANYHLRERRVGAFTRSLRLPTAINADKIEASYENGVLILNVPKAEAVKPKKIAVRSVIEG